VCWGLYGRWLGERGVSSILIWFLAGAQGRAFCGGSGRLRRPGKGNVGEWFRALGELFCGLSSVEGGCGAASGLVPWGDGEKRQATRPGVFAAADKGFLVVAVTTAVEERSCHMFSWKRKEWGDMGWVWKRGWGVPRSRGSGTWGEKKLPFSMQGRDPYHQIKFVNQDGLLGCCGPSWREGCGRVWAWEGWRRTRCRRGFARIVRGGGLLGRGGCPGSRVSCVQNLGGMSQSSGRGSRSK